MDRMKLTRNGDTFEAGELFTIAKALTDQAEVLDQRGALESAQTVLRVACKVLREYGDYHSEQDCRKKVFEVSKRIKLKHEQASTITNAVIAAVERLHPPALRFQRKDVGIWSATAPGFGKRPTLQFTIERQGKKWTAKTSQSVRGHGFVPLEFDTAANLPDAKIACQRRLVEVEAKHA